MAADHDVRFMDLALRLAKRGLGATAPNPSVGALVVDESSGELVARGLTGAGGRPHAETEALRKAGARARGATLYTTLEPCSHHGQTPPCAEAIIAAGIRRVVCAVEDPDPRVAGGGLARLRAAGIAVESGVLAEEARWVAAGHVVRMTTGRPFVQVKLAVDAQGLVPPARAGRPVFVTGPQARAFAHLLRARADAIVIGRRTFEADDPELTCRLPGLAHRSPVRVVLGSTLDLLAGSRLMQTAAAAPVWLMRASDADRIPANPLPAAVVVHRVKRAADGTGLDLRETLRRLADQGITRALVEGGPTLAAALLDAGLADECVIFKGAESVERDEGILPFGTAGLERVEQNPNWRWAGERPIGTDKLFVYRRI